jgi:hypothetical protein
MTRRVLRIAAGVVPVLGIFIALVLMGPKACGMDAFDCSPNGARVGVVIGSFLIAVVLVLLSIPDYGRSEQSRR